MIWLYLLNYLELLQGYESCAFFQGHSSLPVNSLDLTVVVPHPRIPVQGHILSTGRDALRDEPETSQLHSHTNIRNLSP
jgi:hypothetical protein